MPENQGINIRKFESRDREAVRRIFHDTALIGEPASVFFEGEEAFSDALTSYFTDYEPQSCFVAESGTQVIGCLMGAKDKVRAEKIFNAKIAPGLLRKAFRDGLILKKKNIVFLLRCLSDALRGRLFAPDFAKEYPAILHINVGKGFRGQDVGGALMDSYLAYLKQEKVMGVHLATLSDAAASFFKRQGFQLLHRSVRSYFRHVLHRDVPLYIYGKKLLIDVPRV